MPIAKPKVSEEALDAVGAETDFFPEPIKIASTPSPDPATVDSFRANRVPYCEMCGQQICRNEYAQVVCPYDEINCPVITK
jgi:hypothetical protein